MSIIFGIFQRQGSPINGEHLKVVENVLLQFPHQRYQVKLINNAAFGCLLTIDTPESVNDDMPVYLEHEQLVFVAKGRLDNRSELFSALTIPSCDTIADSTLMLLCYQHWGKAVSNKLLGDWAFAVFHVDQQELFVARDHHGYTALDYYFDDNLVVFSSNPKVLLALPAVPKRLNVNSVVRTMLIAPGGALNVSFFEDIYRLPGGHYFEVNSIRDKLERYWCPEQVATNYSRSAMETAAELRQLLKHAISARMRNIRPVTSMLSGGLDSSTVSFLAAEALHRQSLSLTTLSHVPLFTPSTSIDQSRLADETDNILATVRASGNIAPFFLKSEHTSILDGMQHYLDICGSPIHAASNCYWLFDIMQTAARSGFGIVLSGDMGNATISFNGVASQLPIQKFFRYYGFAKTIKQYVLRPIYTNVYLPLCKTAKQHEAICKNNYLNWQLMSDAELRLILDESRMLPLSQFAVKDSRQLAMTIMTLGHNPRGYYGALVSDYFGVQLTDPTSDKRVLEFALSIPNEQFFDSCGNSKHILKTMMRNRLPDSVLFHQQKGLQSSDIGLRLKQNQAELEQIMTELTQSTLVQKLLDVPALVCDWQDIKKVQDNNYNLIRTQCCLRAMMMGMFLVKVEQLN